MIMCSYCLNSLSFHNRLFGTIPELHSQRSLEHAARLTYHKTFHENLQDC